MYSTQFEALYDTGMYLHFFIHGPKYIKQIINLDETENFAAIQTKLFMKYCASNEINRATNEIKRKNF